MVILKRQYYVAPKSLCPIEITPRPRYSEYCFDCYSSYITRSTCRVFTNESHPEWCGFTYDSGSVIWNNSGDTATLRYSSNVLIDEYIYP